MKEKNLIRIKLYLLITLFGSTFGWIQPRRIPWHIEDGVSFHKEAFNFGVFFMVLLIGFGIIFCYDFYVYIKGSKES